MSFISNFLKSVLSTQVANFITKGFWKLYIKLKSSNIWIKVLWYLEWLVDYSKSYWSKEDLKVTHFLKLYHDEEWWWWELQDIYSEPITKAKMPYQTPVEATNNAQKVLKWFRVLHINEYLHGISISSINAPNFKN